MIGTYHPILITLSIVVGVLAFHVGLDFAERATAVRASVRAGWIAAGAAATGLGIWSLHVIGILAVRVPLDAGATPVTFHVPEMFAAALLAVVAMAPALFVVTKTSTPYRALLAGALVSLAMAGTHYVAIAGLRLPARVSHHGVIVAASYGIALLAATAALWLGTSVRGDSAAAARQRLITAFVLGASAAMTHFIAMTAMRLAPATETVLPEPPSLPGTPGVAAIIAAGIVTLLGLATLAAGIDRRMRQETDRATEQEMLYLEAAAARAEADAARAKAEETASLLLEAARMLGSTLDLDAALRHVTSLFVPRLADYCVVYLEGEGGGFTQVASSHADADKTLLLEELGRLYRPDPANPHSPIGQVVTSRRPIGLWRVSDDDTRRVSDDPRIREIFRALAPRSYVVVPLIARGELLGAVGLGRSTPGRYFDPPDLPLVELLGARAALAVDNAMLYTEAQRAHEAALRTTQLEAQLMQARLDALRAQLNPHFLFNALNTVAMLVRRGAKDDALRAVVSLSEVLRRALARQDEQEIPLREELAVVEHYLQVEQLRFRDRLTVTVDVPAETLEACVPGLVLQPIVENAVRHGVAARAERGRIDITARREDGRLVLSVRDNGPGFPDGWEAAASGRVGLSNTRERLNRLYGDRCRFDPHNAADGGAVVTIEIPFRARG